MVIAVVIYATRFALRRLHVRGKVLFRHSFLPAKKKKKEHIPVWKFVYSWGTLGYFGGGRVEKRLFLSAEPQRRPSDMFWPSRERSGQES